MERTLNKEEYVSVSTYARLKNVSTQTIYNMIKDGRLEYVSFNRGKYRGLLVKK